MDRIFTTADYEKAKDVSNKEIIETLQFLQEIALRDTGYFGQEGYEGDGDDFCSWHLAQIYGKAAAILDSLFSLLNTSEDDEEDWEI